MKKIGAKKCDGAVKAYSSNNRYSSRKTYHCKETFEGVAVPDSETTIYKLDLSSSNFSLTKKTAELTSISYKEALQDSEGWENTELSLSYLTNLENCKAAVETLSESLFRFLEVLGYLETSSLNNKEQLETVHDEVLTSLAYAERDRRVYALLKFAPYVDEQFIQLMSDVRKDDTHTLSWFYADGDLEKQKNRLTVAQTFPLFLQLFIDSEQKNIFSRDSERQAYSSLKHDVEMLKIRSRYKDAKLDKYLSSLNELDELHRKMNGLSISRKELKSLIDQGQDIKSHLAKSISLEQDLSDQTLEKLIRIKTFPERIQYGEFLGALHYLDKVESSWFPANSDELGAFVQCFWKSKELAKYTHKPFNDILDNIQGKWIEWNDLVGPIEDIQTIAKWIDELNQTILLPQVLADLTKYQLHTMTDTDAFAYYTEEPSRRYSFIHRDSREERMQELLQTKEQDAINLVLDNSSELDILACALSWQKNKKEYRKKLSKLSDGMYREPDSWPAVSRQVTSPNGYIISPISSKNEYKKLSDELSGVLGKGVYGCLYKPTHIAAIYKKGEEEAIGAITLTEKFNTSGQVSFLDSEFTVSDTMFSLRRNPSPSPEQRTAMEWYINELSHNNSLKPDWKSIAKTRSENQSNRMYRYLAKRFRFNPIDREQREKAFDIFQNFLPEMFKDKSSDKFISYDTIYSNLKLKNSALLIKFESLKVSRDDIDHTRRGFISFR
jgi:hypothetical protein